MVSTSSLKSQNSLAVSSLLGRADTSEDANNKSTSRRESWQQRTMSGLSADGDNELDTSYLNSMLKSDRSSSELMVEKHGALLEDDMEQHKLLPPKRSAMKREHSSSKRNSLTTDEMFVMEQAKISTMRQMSSISLDRRGSMNSTSSGDNLLAPFNERQHSLRAYSSFDDLMSLGANDDVSMSLIRDELVDGGAEGVNMANMALLRQSGITSSMRSFGTMGSFGNFSNHNQRGRLSSFVSRDSAMQMSMNSIDSVGTGFSGSSGSSREDWMNTFKDMQHINSEGVPWKQETMRDYRQESQRSIFSDISTNMDALDLAAPANFPKMLNISPPTQSITTTRVGVTAMNENYDESQLK
uniref:Uncharacterized protein n=1 Tax=Proboscia inermis TaxID=420281 RepID=A0A7S0C0E2_9STRA|mmetsp:Transcript_19783/g.20072  ORF Transcript_19783/g.20072 Transcript_19783/m.20072 type:complete len:355 (+) Transcript_19783:3-1067(+)